MYFESFFEKTIHMTGPWCDAGNEEVYTVMSISLATQLDNTRSSYQEVDWLNDVQEDFVLPVLDALWPPGHSIGDGGGGSWGACVELVALLGYVSERGKKECKQWGETQLKGETDCLCCRVPRKQHRTNSLAVKWGHFYKTYSCAHSGTDNEMTMTMSASATVVEISMVIYATTKLTHSWR